MQPRNIPTGSAWPPAPVDNHWKAGLEPKDFLTVHKLPFSLATFTTVWRKLFPAFPQVVWKISQGIMVAFLDLAPPSISLPKAFSCNNRLDDLITTTQKLFSRAVIKKVPNLTIPVFHNRLFLIPKSVGLIRPVIDLKSLNWYLEVLSFQMGTLFSIV